MDPSETDLRQAHCWFPSTDRVSGSPQITAYRRMARLHQARWRESKSYPMGSHLSRGIEVPNGSRLGPAGPLEADLRNFLSASIGRSVLARSDRRNKEPGQQILQSRLRLDLLSSMPMCFNLFGELWDDPIRIGSAANALFGIDQPGAEVKFEHSPGRQDLTFTGDGTAFDVAIFLGQEGGPQTVLGIETKYHEQASPERVPTETKLRRYVEIMNSAAGVFKPHAIDRIVGTELQQIWRDHLLLLSMLQQPDRWSGGKYVLVHPAQNPAFSDAGRRYQELLHDDSTFAVATIEELLRADVLHADRTAESFQERYLW